MTSLPCLYSKTNIQWNSHKPVHDQLRVRVRQQLATQNICSNSCQSDLSALCLRHKLQCYDDNKWSFHDLPATGPHLQCEVWTNRHPLGWLWDIEWVLPVCHKNRSLSIGTTMACAVRKQLSKNQCCRGSNNSKNSNNGNHRLNDLI